MRFIHKEFQRWKFQFNLELLIAIIVLMAPFLIYIHLFFSKTSNEINFLNFSWKHEFKHNQLFLWNCLSNFIPVILIFISYLSMKSAIRYFLIPLIIMFSFFLLSDIFYYQYTHFFVNLVGIPIGVFLIFIFLAADKLISNSIFKNDLKITSKEFLKEILTLRMSKLLEHAEITKKFGKEIPKIQYLSRLLYYNEIMKKEVYIDNLSTMPEKEKTNLLGVKFIFSGLILLSALALNFIYLLVPPGLEKFDFGIMSIGNMGFGTMGNLLWFLFKKISVVVFLIVWFSLSQNWWKAAILTPTIIYIYQIFEVFYEIGAVDAGNNSKILPVLFPLIVAIIFLFQIVRQKSKIMDYIDEFEKELNQEIQIISRQE